MNSWADVEEAVAEAITDAAFEMYLRSNMESPMPDDWGSVFAKVAIDKIRELRLTAVAVSFDPSFGQNPGDTLSVDEATGG